MFTVIDDERHPCTSASGIVASAVPSLKALGVESMMRSAVIFSLVAGLHAPAAIAFVPAGSLGITAPSPARSLSNR